MAPKKEPSKKVIDKHAKFLAAWEIAGFPDKFEYEVFSPGLFGQ
jgi:hypothetical protein